MILGNRNFIEIPGSKTHELPPLLVRTRPAGNSVKKGNRLKQEGSKDAGLERVLKMAAELIEQDDLVPFVPLHPEDFAPDAFVSMPEPPGGVAPDPAVQRDLERRRLDMAIHLVEQYMAFVMHWRWGYDILEWIRQCEGTFERDQDLKRLLRADLWPHAGRASFVNLLADKHVAEGSESGGLELDKAVGLRLTFRQPPPLSCFSNQFLIYLRGSLAETAYHKWADMDQSASSSFPPERFHFDVINMNLD